MDVIKKLNYIFTKSEKKGLVKLCFIMFFGALLELMGVSLILPFVQAVTTPDKLLESEHMVIMFRWFKIEDTKQVILLLCGSLIGIYIFKNVFLSYMYYQQYKFAYGTEVRLSTKLMECYMNKSYIFHTQNNSSEIIRGVTTDCAQLISLVVYSLTLLSEGMVSLVLGLYLIYMDPAITIVVVLLIFLCFAVFILALQKRIKEYGKRNQEYNSKRIQIVTQAVGGIKEIKILNRSQFFIDYYSQITKETTDGLKKYNFLNQLPRLIIETICIVGVLAIMAAKIQMGSEMAGIMSSMAVFAMSAFRLLPSANRINNSINWILFYKASIDLVYRDLQKTQNETDQEENRLISVSSCNNPVINNTISDIWINSVSYIYPNAKEHVFMDVDFHIESGTSIALIGPSGAGKTTLADLILGVLKPSTGNIYIDGLDIQEHMELWHSHIGYIPQDIYLLDDTIKNNVAFGIDEDKINTDNVWKALEEAQLADFVKRLEKGLDTMVGEMGARISGGQKQRIGIARALYGNPDVLVLDEATSALDNETEKAVMETINMLQGKKTLIIIAHRLSTIRGCDKVYRVEKQKVTVELK